MKSWAHRARTMRPTDEDAGADVRAGNGHGKGQGKGKGHNK